MHKTEVYRLGVADNGAKAASLLPWNRGKEIQVVRRAEFLYDDYLPNYGGDAYLPHMLKAGWEVVGVWRDGTRVVGGAQPRHLGAGPT